MLRKIIIGLCIILMSGMLFANIYISIVDAHSWVSNIPQSIYTARDYFSTVNPGNFFRLFAPILQGLFLVLIIACWSMGPRQRSLCVLAFLISLGINLFTFAYFYPRNEIILHSPDADLIRSTVNEWISMDRLRTALSLINVMVCFIIQSKIYAKTNTLNQ